MGWNARPRVRARWCLDGGLIGRVRVRVREHERDEPGVRNNGPVDREPGNWGTEGRTCRRGGRWQQRGKR